MFDISNIFSIEIEQRISYLYCYWTVADSTSMNEFIKKTESTLNLEHPFYLRMKQRFIIYKPSLTTGLEIVSKELHEQFLKEYFPTFKIKDLVEDNDGQKFKAVNLSNSELIMDGLR